MADADLIGRRILVVEDDYLIAMDLSGWLQDLGAQIVGMAGSVSEALSLIEAPGERIDGAILDVNLAGERVYPVADALMARAISFVFVTGYDRWIVPGTYAHVPRCDKPVRFDILARHLISMRVAEQRLPS